MTEKILEVTEALKSLKKNNCVLNYAEETDYKLNCLFCRFKRGYDCDIDISLITLDVLWNITDEKEKERGK